MPDTPSLRKPGTEETVTLIVKHRVKAGFEQPYEAWLRNIVSVAGREEGHLGVDVMRSKQGGLALFTCAAVLLDRGDAALARLPQRQALIEEATPMLADGDQTEVNPVNEFWFTPAGRRWLATATLEAGRGDAVRDPAAHLAGAAALGAAAELNAWLSNYLVATFLITLTIVLSVVYVCMPAATRLFAPWLAATQPHEHLSTPIRRADFVSLISKERDERRSDSVQWPIPYR
jgi:antibiotic biosynthesis monooxygenase (ABM) superfamily enzyme